MWVGSITAALHFYNARCNAVRNCTEHQSCLERAALQAVGGVLSRDAGLRVERGGGEGEGGGGGSGGTGVPESSKGRQQKQTWQGQIPKRLTKTLQNSSIVENQVMESSMNNNVRARRQVTNLTQSLLF